MDIEYFPVKKYVYIEQIGKDFWVAVDSRGAPKMSRMWNCGILENQS